MNKYLNREDIEECGFELIGEKIVRDIHQVFRRYDSKTQKTIVTLNYLGNKQIKKIETYQDTLMNEAVNNDSEWQCVNSMVVKIKNLSELKKLLNQLGISYEE